MSQLAKYNLLTSAGSGGEVNPPDYYYTKPSDPSTMIAPASNTDELAAVAQWAVENKNPLNLSVPGQAELRFGLGQVIEPHYEWPLPFFFSDERYRSHALEGCTPYRLAQNFWATIDTVKPDMSVFAGELFLLAPGQKTTRRAENPGGPKTSRWMFGGSCRLFVAIKTNEGVSYTIGNQTLVPEVNTVYEINNLLINQVVNAGTEDAVFLAIDLVPNDKKLELENRLNSNEIMNQLHIVPAAGYPIHTTVHL